MRDVFELLCIPFVVVAYLGAVMGALVLLWLAAKWLWWAAWAFLP